MAGRRRLFELLQEQQEPFLLDVYLLERGFCSADNAFKSWRSQALLKRLLKKPFDWVRRTADCWNHREVDSEQVSTVSVLELRSCGSSPVHPLRRHADENSINVSTVGFDLPRKVQHIFNELLEVAVAYTPAIYKLLGSKRQLHRSDELILLDSERNAAKKGIREKVPPWGWQKRFASTGNLIISDLSGCDVQWSGNPRHQVEEFAAEIEADLFEYIKEETILEMIGPHCTSMTVE